MTKHDRGIVSHERKIERNPFKRIISREVEAIQLIFLIDRPGGCKTSSFRGWSEISKS